MSEGSEVKFASQSTLQVTGWQGLHGPQELAQRVEKAKERRVEPFELACLVQLDEQVWEGALA